MSEDMTYTTTEPTRAQLAARVRELEAQNADLLAAAVTNAQEMLALRVECEGLRAQIKLKPWLLDVIAQTINGHVSAEDTLRGWILAQGFDVNDDGMIGRTAQPDDTDAPLTLAALDEDGDE